MSAYLNPRIGRVADHEIGTCACREPRHPGPYRAQVTTAGTGVLNTAYLCPNRAAAWAARFGIDFPPGMWRDTPTPTAPTPKAT